MSLYILTNGYIYMIFCSRTMAYRQIGGQASHGSRGVSGGQARGSGGQASTRKTPSRSRTSSQFSRLPKCIICSQNQLKVQDKRDMFHKHFSSKYARECTGLDQAPGDYFCLTCKAIHSSIQNTRLKICLSTSMLHEFWAPRGSKAIVYEGDKSHIDYITIPGGKIADLINAWKIEYFQETRPMDVMLIAGLNNLVKGWKPDEMLREYDYLVQSVMYQAHKYHPELHNTCAIGTLYYPPQLCWFPGQGNCPTDFSDHLQSMQYLNHEIERLNQESGLKSPNFPVFGVRGAGKHTLDRNGNWVWRDTTHHRYEHWRETEYRDMLHLTDEKRMKMGRWVGKYFEKVTGNFVQP